MSLPLQTKIQNLKRDTILEKAAILFEEHGFQAMKITDLAKEVGISIGSIYALFESKDQLYMAYIHQKIDLFLEQLIAVSKDSSPEETLFLFITMRFEVCAQMRKAFDNRLVNNPVFDSILTSGLEDPIEKVYIYLASIIALIQPSAPSRTSIEQAYLLEGLCDAQIKHWNNHPEIDLMSKIIPLHHLFITLTKENL